MARYLNPKFNWILLQSRQLSNKLDTFPVSSALTGQNSEEDREEATEDNDSSRIRYNVCKDRNVSSQKFVFNKKSLQNKLAYIQDHTPKASVVNKEVTPATTDKDKDKGYRLFTASTTYKNVTLPLKSSKLANPFPEPVKVMPSHTVSDQEKADQMQAECRVPRSIKKSKRLN